MVAAAEQLGVLVEVDEIDQQLLAEVLAIFAPVKNLGHLEGLKENN